MRLLSLAITRCSSSLEASEHFTEEITEEEGWKVDAIRVGMNGGRESVDGYHGNIFTRCYLISMRVGPIPAQDTLSLRDNIVHT